MVPINKYLPKVVTIKAIEPSKTNARHRCDICVLPVGDTAVYFKSYCTGEDRVVWHLICNVCYHTFQDDLEYLKQDPSARESYVDYIKLVGTQ